MTTARAAAKAIKEAEQRLKKAHRAAILLKQASDATRVQLLLKLAEEECYVGVLCEALNQSQPAVSHHLALLRHGGMVTTRRSGKQVFYSLTETGRSLAAIVKAVV
jgi:DNA-binding transcriptional ArsR family regulator